MSNKSDKKQSKNDETEIPNEIEVSETTSKNVRKLFHVYCIIILWIINIIIKILGNITNQVKTNKLNKVVSFLHARISNNDDYLHATLEYFIHTKN